MNDLPEFEGFWWSPDDPETKLAGRLVADDDAAKLILTINNPGRRLFSRSESREYEVLHGSTSDGKLITLLKCFDLNSSWSSNGIEKRIVLANYVLVGGLVPEDRVENAFGQLSLKWPGLQRWFFRSGISVDHDKDNLYSFTIKYTPLEPINFEYSADLNIEFSFSTDKLPSGGALSEKVEFREIVWVSLKKSAPASLSFFLEKLNELVQFFSICILEYNQPEEVTLVGDFDKKTRQDGTEIFPHLTVYFSSVQKAQSDRLPHPINVLVPYASIQDNFQHILHSWGALAKSISPARALYFSSLYGRNSYIESTFLSLAQAAEVFHRRQYGGTYLDEDTYQNDIRPILEKAIPSDLSKDVKLIYKQRFQFFNEYSLHMRLKLMAATHEAIFCEFVPDWNSKIRSIVSARNYYTHYSEDGGNSAPDINKLVQYREFLRMLLELEMLRATGIDLIALHKQARNCQQYRWTFSQNW